MGIQWKGFYACQAADEAALGGRCRRKAQQDGMCYEGGHMTTTAPATPPRTILINFSLSIKMFVEAERLGFRRQTRVMSETQARHELESGLTRRSFIEYRQVGDTGSAVFGKEGLPNVKNLGTTIAEILKAERGFGDAHLEAAPDGGGRLMVIHQDKSIPKEYASGLTAEMGQFLNRLGTDTWEKCFVWDNPPRWHATVEFTHGKPYPIQFHILKELGNGGVVAQVIRPKMPEPLEIPAEVRKAAIRAATSTVNLRGRGATKPGVPGTTLLWNGGYWDAKEVTPS